jgi:hypothetical protein
VTATVEHKHTGRPGMTLWEILVFGTVRLARDADYDHLHHMANHVSGKPGISVPKGKNPHHIAISFCSEISADLIFETIKSASSAQSVYQ